MRVLILNLLCVVVLFLVFISSCWAGDSSFCIYLDARGNQKQVSSIKQVPPRYRKKARCATNTLAKPSDIELKGNVRVETINSSLGRINLRWPRSVETVFGRNPLRATTEAARVVSRVLKKASFPTRLRSMNIEWNIVFMDASLSTTQIPARLVDNCHPGWMTPPSNIYIVAQRVADRCNPNSRTSAQVADSRLAEVLTHELGHAVEYHILQEAFGTDVMRAEGFATWFTVLASESSSMLNTRKLRRETFDAARRHIRASPDHFDFDGSSAAYARAALYFYAIQKRVGVNGLMRVYKLMAKRKINFFQAVYKELRWDQARLNKEVRALL